MKSAQERYKMMVAAVPSHIRSEVNLSFDISNKIACLMKERGLSKKQFAEALGKRPCEVTKWLSGQHNFTLATLSMISDFFGKAIVTVE